MRNPKLLPLALLIASAALSACAGARLVRRADGGGTVALSGLRRGAAREKAEALMQEYCGGPYEIVAEEEVSAGMEGNVMPLGDAPASQHVHLEDKKEWHITFECASAQARAKASSAR